MTHLRSRRILFASVLLIAMLPLSGRGIDSRLLNSLLAERYVEIAAWRLVPGATRAAMRKAIGGIDIAEKGSPWNASDALGPRLLRRRFVAVGVSANRAVLIYEHGNIGVPHQHAVCFGLSGTSYRVVANLSLLNATSLKDFSAARISPLVSDHY